MMIKLIAIIALVPSVTLLSENTSATATDTSTSSTSTDSPQCWLLVFLPGLMCHAIWEIWFSHGASNKHFEMHLNIYGCEIEQR